MAKMVIESGTADLTPGADEFQGPFTGHAWLTGESAQYAVEALGRRQRLVIDGIEYELDELRLRRVET